jgi:hypothetical protein
MERDERAVGERMRRDAGASCGRRLTMIGAFPSFPLSTSFFSYTSFFQDCGSKASAEVKKWVPLVHLKSAERQHREELVLVS